MKKLLLALSFCAALWAAPASATCSAVFKPGSVCGNAGASNAFPGEIPNSSIVGTIPLPSADILVGNASNKAAAVAPSGAGDCTFTFTNAGVFTYTCLKTNGTPFGTLAVLNGSYVGNTTNIATYTSVTKIPSGHVATGDGNGNLQDGGGAAGTVTSVACGTGLSCSPSPITNTGTVSAAQAPTFCKGFSGNVCPSTATSGTYTTPAGVTWLEVYFCGGGGGGGGTGTAAASSGGTGGTSTFNSVNVIGGSGGALGSTSGGGAPAAGGVGGTGGTGTAQFRFSGSGGGAGGGSVTSSLDGYGGNGGAAGFGFGGGGRANGGSAGAGQTPAGFCGGGSGGFSLSGAQGGAGGGGGGEAAYLLITSPVASYSWTTGSAGTAGTAGTSGQAGGAGAIGGMYTIEHYGS